MYGTGTKKMLNMLILDILREYSYSEHRLLQQDIIDLLKTNYGMDCERRAVKNNIVSLQEMGYENGLNLKEHLAEHFYMYSGDSIHIKLKAHENLMDNLLDSFGKDFRVIPEVDDEIVVRLKCNPDTFFYWAMQYGLNIEVLEPESMRERIKNVCKEIEKKYR